MAHGKIRNCSAVKTARDMHTQGRRYAYAQSHQEFQDASSAAELEEQEQSRALSDLGNALATMDKELKDLKKYLKRFAVTQTNDLEPAAPELVAMGIDLMDALDASVQAYQGSEKAFNTVNEQSRNAYEKFKDVLNSADVGKHLSAAVLAALLGNEFDTACENFLGIATALSERRSTLELEIARIQGDFDKTVMELELLANEAIGVLHAAVAKKVPRSVPGYADVHMLKMGVDPRAVTADARRTNLSHYLMELIESQRLPDRGGDLAADAVLAIAGVKSLRIKILKASKHLEVDYCPVDAIPSSGGGEGSCRCHAMGCRGTVETGQHEWQDTR